MGSAVSSLVDAVRIRGSDNPTTSVSESSIEDSQLIRTRVSIDLVSQLSNVDWKYFASEVVRKLDLPAQALMRWFRGHDQSVSVETGLVTGIGKKATTTRCDSLLNDLQADVLQRLDVLDRSSLKAVSTYTGSEKFVESDGFRQLCGGVSEGAFTAINYYIRNNVRRCSGYGLHSKSWKSFSTVPYLPPPDAELFKEYSVCGHGGLMCAEVSKLPKKGELVVFNPLTGETRALPPLLHPRNPVLVHISVDSAKRSYKVIVAGSSAASDEHLSRKVEVFDSSTSKWTGVSDLAGPAFGLNEHQAGVCLNGKLFLISFLESGGRGVVAFDVENGTWLQDLTVPIPWSSYSNTLQLVESDGKLFVFSEQEQDLSVDHCIDELEFPNPMAGVLTCRWRSFVKVKKFGGRGLQVYPEHTCVGFGEGKLCIFNTLCRDGVVYDMRDGKECEDLVPPPANQIGDNFFSLNPASFTLQPNREQQRNHSVDHCIHELGIFSPLNRKKLHYLLASCITLSLMPNGVCAEDQSIQDSPSSMRVPPNAWENPEFAKKAAVTLLVGLTMIGGRFAWGIFRRGRTPGDQFDIMQGLEDSDTPTRENPSFAILPDILA